MESDFMLTCDNSLTFTQIFNFVSEPIMPPPTRTKIKPMTDKALILRVILETIAILLTSIPLFYLYVINTGDVQPFKRGFFCDDENLKHPYSEEQIPDGLCALIWVVAVVTCVVLVEGLTNCVHEFPQWSAALMKKGANKTAKIPRYAYSFIQMIFFKKKLFKICL
jgi:hypothetical protein